MMEYPIKVDFEYTDNAFVAYKWLRALPNIFAVDFETASRYTIQEKEKFKVMLGVYKNTEDIRVTKQKIDSDGLSHPRFSCITHLSLGISSNEAKVIICNTEKMRKIVTNFLVTTDKKQIWHNAAFDFKHIEYMEHKIPKNFVDTKLLAKVLLNNANNALGGVGLKELMGYAYGPWSIAKENPFTQENIYNEKLIGYAAIDGAATYKLYKDIIEDLRNEDV